MIWLGIIGIIRFASLLGDPPERLTEERAYPVLRFFILKNLFNTKNLVILIIWFIFAQKQEQYGNR